MSSPADNKTCDEVAFQQLDTSGTRCPLPLIRAKQALKTMQAGEVLRVLATDPAAKPDFDAMLSHLPHEMIAYTRQTLSGDAYPWVDVIDIRKGVEA